MSAPGQATPAAPAGGSGNSLTPGSAPLQDPAPWRRSVWIPVLAVVLALAAITGGWLLINELTRRNLAAVQVSVPGVALMLARDAQNTLTAADLRPILHTAHDDEVGRDLAVRDVQGTEAEAGTVVGQDQVAGSEVPQDSSVTVEVATALASLSPIRSANEG